MDADNSDVTVVSASFGGDDVLAKLATTNNKKYFMVPEADLATKTYVVKAKGTDVAETSAEASYNQKVSSEKIIRLLSLQDGTTIFPIRSSK